ncbi:glycoside hydrolase family 76 protein [Corynebacterium neomassiliense]|uniref:glycoside hydrolase family 76 protein n=1 Tax=Corynebacterium neomassiliense TaxID=2079482 RepID=UPI00102FE77E|nr:glycoside hydrolase family 76 protein [Corynebacterium neomassiliense]
MEEIWDHRADLAEQAVLERHVTRLWGIPKTSLAVIAWPPTTRDKFFYHWHCWWQAQFIDCQVDAATRRATGRRLRRIRRTVRAVRIRNRRALPHNEFYDDRAWLALAMHRAGELPKYGSVRYLPGLCSSLLDGIDPLTGVLPWRDGQDFFNVTTNGPAAILAARTGRRDLTGQFVEWVYPRLINADGLVTDGVRLRLHGEEQVPRVHTVNQGLVLGALVELARSLRKDAGVPMGAVSEVGTRCLTRVHQLVQAVATHMATTDGIIDTGDTGDPGLTGWQGNGGGDGGLFKGVLARYLALVATGLPSDDRLGRATRQLARRLVLQSAESVWHHRLEVDGLPLFGASWGRDAALPRTGGRVGTALASGPGAGLGGPGRDLSVQVSGWMLMEAAVRVTGGVVRDSTD